MNKTPEPRTIRDYFAMLRRRRGAIVAITLIAAGLAMGLSLTQEETFTSDASIRVKDPADELSLGGILPSQGDVPAQVAAQAAITATRETVIEGARRKLGLSQSVAALQDRVEAKQDPETNLINITAEAKSAIEAARLANAVADEAVKETNAESREQFRSGAADLRTQAEQASNDEEKSILSTQAGRLEALSTVTNLSEVTERAAPPSSPSAPKPVRNAIIAGFFGLIIGLVVAAILESIDRRLRDPDEIQDELGLPLVGVIAHHALGGVPVAGVPGEEHVAAMDMFRMLRTNVAFLNVDRPAKLVLVTSSLPDEGKTTVATGLALSSAVTGRRTLLIETDLHRPVHAERLGIAEAPGLTDQLAGEALPQDVLQGLRFTDPGARENGSEAHQVILSCIAAGTTAGRSAELIGSQRFADFLGEVSPHYDLIVLDSAPVLAVAETLEIAPLVDTILFVVRLGRTTLDEARRGVNALARLPKRSTGLVLTDLGAADTSGYNYYSYSYSYRFNKAAKPLARK